MDAYVSGQTGRAVLVQGNDAFIVDLEAQNEQLRVPIGFIFNAFGEAADVVELKATSRERALRRLKDDWQRDRSLRIFLIFIDRDEYVETKEAAANVLTEFFAEPQNVAFVKNHLLSRPLPRSADLETAVSLLNKPSELRSFIDLLEKAQPTIFKYRAAWDDLPSDLFEDNAARSRIENYLIESGAFSALVDADDNPKSVNSVLFNCLRDLRREKNFREIVHRWTRDAPKRSHTRPEPLIEEDSEKISELDINDLPRQPRSGRRIFENVQLQQKAISDQLKKGNEAQARRYVDQLVQGQLKSGGPAYASKSLCKLAQDAKSVGLHSLQLEWAKRASDLAPDDGWAHGQTADALIYFNRFDEARRSLALADSHGQSAFAITGHARILRAQGKLDEALTAYMSAKAKLSGENLVFAWLGHAEVLRDMWLFPQALEIYEETIEKFANSKVAHCGRAAVLTDMGRLDEALREYEGTLRSFGDDIVPLNGRIQVWKLQGRLEDALAECNEVIARYPAEHISYAQRGDILKLAGDLDSALDAYSRAAARFPHISALLGGIAEVLREQRHYWRSLETYENGISRFQFDSRLRNGRANVLKLTGQLDLALKAYDETVRLFPYDLISLSGRADLLKEIGDFGGAVALYDRIIQNWPGFYAAKHAKAAILVVLGRYDEADELLAKSVPQTRDEWIGFQVRGMILLRSGRTDEAVDHLTKGLVGNPYSKERKYFENALAVARLRRNEYELASKLVEHAIGPVGNVIQLHAFAAAGMKSQARMIYDRSYDDFSPKLVELRDEIASRFNLRSARPSRDDTWIFQQECESILLLDAA